MREMVKNSISVRYMGRVYVVPKNVKVELDRLLKPWEMTAEDEKAFTKPETALPAKKDEKKK